MNINKNATYNRGAFGVSLPDAKCNRLYSAVIFLTPQF